MSDEHELTIDSIRDEIARHGGLPRPDIVSALLDRIARIPDEAEQDVLATAIKQAVRGRELKGLVAARHARMRDKWKAPPPVKLGEFVFDNENDLVDAMNKHLALVIKRDIKFCYTDGKLEFHLDREGAAIIFAKYQLVAKTGEVHSGFNVWLRSSNRREIVRNY